MAVLPLYHKNDDNTATTDTTEMSFYQQFKFYFIAAFGATAGYMAMMALLALWCAAFAIPGYYLLQGNNKEETKLFEDMNGWQYFGAVLIAIGVLPFAAYFFQAIMFSMGSEAGSDIYSSIV